MCLGICNEGGHGNLKKKDRRLNAISSQAPEACFVRRPVRENQGETLVSMVITQSPATSFRAQVVRLSPLGRVVTPRPSASKMPKMYALVVNR